MSGNGRRILKANLNAFTIVRGKSETSYHFKCIQLYRQSTICCRFGLLLDLLVCLKSLDIEADLPCDRAKWRKWIHIAHPN
jgi:hypothetical protein